MGAAYITPSGSGRREIVMASALRQLIIVVVVALCHFPAACLADDAAAARKAAEDLGGRALPAEAMTNHTLTIGGEKIAFTARAGAIRLRDAQSDAPQADVAYVSYERNGVDASTRPVVFLFNGGPGAASAWLGLGAVSPWRLRVTPETLSPSAPPAVVDNMESWLPFADLVFIDPPGTGFSKLLSDSEDLKKRFYSVQGDADALAVALRKWLTARGRLASPKFLVGESYGGFRVSKIVRALRERESVGVEGLFLISPALDFTWLSGPRNPLSYIAYLPSFAAVARGATDRAALQDVESYASGDYAADLLRGLRDPQALARLADNVSRFTGLDRALVGRLGGRIDSKTFSRERVRDAQRVSSLYDGEITGHDPTPFAPQSDWADPILDSLRAPLGAAMIRLTSEKLNWPVGDARYVVLNGQVNHLWDFGREGRATAEAVTDLRDALALDPHLRLVVVHGLADLVTPYFASKLLLDQLPPLGDASRASLVVLPGGHMPYFFHEDSRRALRDAARKAIEGD